MCSSSTNMFSEGHVFFLHQQHVFRRPCVLPPPTTCFQKAIVFFLHQQHVFYSLLISFFVIFYITLINNLPKSDFVIFYITLINNLPKSDFVIFCITLINNLPKSDFVIFYITLINNLPKSDFDGSNRSLGSNKLDETTNINKQAALYLIFILQYN